MQCGKDPFRLAKAKLGLDVVFHLPKKKLSGCFRLYRSCTSDAEAQSSSVMPSPQV